MPDDDAPDPSAGGPLVRPVEDGQWGVVAWLFQLFRHDLAPVVGGLPYADGRYRWTMLERYPSPRHLGYLAWRPHPNTGVDAPVGFALVERRADGTNSLEAFWVSPVLRRRGVGRALATDVIARHAGPWVVAFQHDNVAAGSFWRRVADASFGAGAWRESTRPVPGRPDAPPDHFLEAPG